MTLFGKIAPRIPALCLLASSAAVLLLLSVSGCNDAGGYVEDPDPVSDSIRAFLPANLQDTLRKYGLVIHPGDTPPDVEGNYFGNSLKRKDGNVPGDNLVSFSNLSLNFSGQTAGQRLSVRYNWGNVAILEGNEAFITGSGDAFTICLPSQVTYVSRGDTVEYASAECYSGTLGEAGISGFVTGFIVTDKSEDPLGIVVKAGQGRVIEERDGLAERVADYPHAGEARKPAAQALEGR